MLTLRPGQRQASQESPAFRRRARHPSPAPVGIGKKPIRWGILPAIYRYMMIYIYIYMYIYVYIYIYMGYVVKLYTIMYIILIIINNNNIIISNNNQ